MITAE